MKKETLLQVAMTTERAILKYGREQHERAMNLVITSKNYKEIEKIMEALEKTRVLTQDGYVYATKNMTVKELEDSLEKFMDAKSILIMIDCQMDRIERDNK